MTDHGGVEIHVNDRSASSIKGCDRQINKQYRMT